MAGSGMPGHWIKYGGHPNPTSWIAQGKDNLQLIEKNPNRLQLAELKKPGPGGGGVIETLIPVTHHKASREQEESPPRRK